MQRLEWHCHTKSVSGALYYITVSLPEKRWQTVLSSISGGTQAVTGCWKGIPGTRRISRKRSASSFFVQLAHGRHYLTTTMTMIKQWVIIEDEVEHAVDVKRQENYPVVIPDFAVTKSELRMELHWCPLLDSPVFTISHRITNTIAVITATINGTISCDCSIQGEKPTGPVSLTSHKRTAVVKIGESTALFLYGEVL